MDNHPLARRPHKSPAHTVKDRRNRPQRLIPFCLFPFAAEASEGAAHYRVVFVAVNTLLRFFSTLRPVPASLRRSHILAGFDSFVNTRLPVSTAFASELFGHLCEGCALYGGFRIRQHPCASLFPSLRNLLDSAAKAAHCRGAFESVNTPARLSFHRLEIFRIPLRGPRIIGGLPNPSTPRRIGVFFASESCGHRCEGAHCARQQCVWEGGIDGGCILTSDAHS